MRSLTRLSRRGREERCLYIRAYNYNIKKKTKNHTKPKGSKQRCWHKPFTKHKKLYLSVYLNKIDYSYNITLYDGLKLLAVFHTSTSPFKTQKQNCFKKLLGEAIRAVLRISRETPITLDIHTNDPIIARRLRANLKRSTQVELNYHLYHTLQIYRKILRKQNHICAYRIFFDPTLLPTNAPELRHPILKMSKSKQDFHDFKQTSHRKHCDACTKSYIRYKKLLLKRIHSRNPKYKLSNLDERIFHILLAYRKPLKYIVNKILNRSKKRKQEVAPTPYQILTSSIPSTSHYPGNESPSLLSSTRDEKDSVVVTLDLTQSRGNKTTSEVEGTTDLGPVQTCQGSMQVCDLQHETEDPYPGLPTPPRIALDATSDLNGSKLRPVDFVSSLAICKSRELPWNFLLRLYEQWGNRSNMRQIPIDPECVEEAVLEFP